LKVNKKATSAAASQKNLRPAKSSNKPAAIERIIEIQSILASDQGKMCEHDQIIITPI
jgi:uncharacterized membrane protein (DUF106 family)